MFHQFFALKVKRIFPLMCLGCTHKRESWQNRPKVQQKDKNKSTFFFYSKKFRVSQSFSSEGSTDAAAVFHAWNAHTLLKFGVECISRSFVRCRISAAARPGKHNLCQIIWCKMETGNSQKKCTSVQSIISPFCQLGFLRQVHSNLQEYRQFLNWPESSNNITLSIFYKFCSFAQLKVSQVSVH